MSSLDNIDPAVSDTVDSNRMRLNEVADEVIARLGLPETEAERKIQAQFRAVLSYLPVPLVNSIVEYHQHIFSNPGRVALVQHHGFISLWNELWVTKSTPEGHICRQMGLLRDILSSVENTIGESSIDEFVNLKNYIFQKIIGGDHIPVIQMLDYPREISELLEQVANLDEIDESDIPLNIARAVCAYKGLDSAQVRNIAAHIKGRMDAIEEGVHKIVDGINKFNSAVHNVPMKTGNESVREEG
jgi:hypothetical protein